MLRKALIPDLSQRFKMVLLAELKVAGLVNRRYVGDVLFSMKQAKDTNQFQVVPPSVLLIIVRQPAVFTRTPMYRPFEFFK